MEEKIETPKKESKIGKFLNKYFHFYDLGGSMKNEIFAGISMFIVSIFLILFNMQVIHDQFYASEVYPTVYFGLYFGAVLISFIGTIVIGIIARMPLVQVSGLGMSSTIISLAGSFMGLTYGNVMAINLISSIIFVIIFAVPFLRKKIIDSIPTYVKKALPVLVGLMTCLLCLKNSNLIDTSANTFTFSIGKYLKTDMYGTIYVLTLVAVIVSFVFANKNKNGHPAFFSLFVGLAVYFVGVACYGLLNISSLQLRGFLLIVTDDNSFGLVEGIKALSTILKGNESGSIPSLFKEMWDFSSVAANGGNVVALFIQGIITFLAVGMFGSYGVCKDIEEGVLENGDACSDLVIKHKPNTDLALLTVGATNVISSFVGVMPNDLSIVNTVGKKDRAKTGLASIVSGICFFISLFTMAIIALFATDLGNSAYGHANEFSATISGVSSYIVYIVGFIASFTLIATIKKCDFSNKSEYLPLIIMVVIGLFTSNIVYGMAASSIAYLLITLFDKNSKKEISQIISSSVISALGIIVFITAII